MNSYLLDTHVHTSEVSPCGRVPGAELPRLYKEAGFDGIIITDHFLQAIPVFKSRKNWIESINAFLEGYKNARLAGEAVGLDVFLGAELRFSGRDTNDYLLFGLTEEKLKRLGPVFQQDLARVKPVLETEEVLVVQAHPYRGAGPAPAYLLDGVEAYNGHKGHESFNHTARAFGNQHHLIQTGGSDCHYYDAVGTGGIILPKQPKDEEEITRLLRNKEYRIFTDAGSESQLSFSH
ncbi:MAG: PHP-associated domain-containing protein [Spirochaetia bacterium]